MVAQETLHVTVKEASGESKTYTSQVGGSTPVTSSSQTSATQTSSSSGTKSTFTPPSNTVWVNGAPMSVAQTPTQPVVEQPKPVSQDVQAAQYMSIPGTTQTIGNKTYTNAPIQSTALQPSNNQREWTQQFVSPAQNVAPSDTLYGMIGTFVGERNRLIQEKVNTLPQTFFLTGGKAAYGLLGGTFTETGRAAESYTPQQVTSKLVGFGALSSMVDVTRGTGKPVADFIGVGRTEGSAFRFGNEITTVQKSTLQFETSSIWKPNIAVDVLSLNKGKVTNANIFKDVGLYQAESSELTKPLYFGRVSTTTTKGDIFATIGQFFNQRMEASAFGTVGRLTRVDELGLRSYSSITAQESIAGKDILTAMRTTETSSINYPYGLLRTNYESVSAISTGKLPTMNIQTVGRSANLPTAIETPSSSSNIFNLFKTQQFSNLVKEQPIVQVQQALVAQLGRENFIFNALPKAASTTIGAINEIRTISLPRQEPNISQFFTGQPKFIEYPKFATSPKTTQPTSQIPLLGTPQLIVPKTTQPTSQIPLLGTPPTIPFTPPPTVPFIPPVYGIFPLAGFSGREPKASGFWRNVARYTPNFRGLESGARASKAFQTQRFTGLEVRGLPKDLSRALGLTSRKRRKRR